MAKKGPKNKPRQKDSAVEAAFEQLSLRFFLNLPQDELNSFDRIFFQLSQAWWFYEDFLREENDKLPQLDLRLFCEQFFHECDVLKPFLDNFESCFKEFQKYVGRVPVYGCILLNPAMTKCLLVKGWSGRYWGFPKGKIDHSESEVDCAIREVREEIGYDVSAQLSPNDRLVTKVNGKEVTLFVVTGVNEDSKFATNTIKEISEIKWFSLKALSNKNSSKQRKKYFQVIAFLPKLKDWIQKQSKKNGKTKVKPIDHQNNETFGSDVTQGWKPEDMFAQNLLLKANSSDQSSGDTVDSNESASDLMLGSDSEGWSAEEMFQLNQELYGVKTCKILNLDDLSASLAASGSGFKSYSKNSPLSQPKTWTFEQLVAANSGIDFPSLPSSPSSSQLGDVPLFSFDRKKILKALLADLS